MRLAFGSDHAGFRQRLTLGAVAASLGHAVEHFGAAGEEAFDYPLASDEVACAVLEGRAEAGVLVCGTGIGVCIRANRYPGIRAALCPTPEAARAARLHNHANVLCLGSRLMSPTECEAVLRTFLTTDPDPAARHVARVGQLDRNATCPGMVERRT